MNATESLIKFLTGMGCQRRGDKFVLDGFDSEFYLMFDTTLDQDEPQPGTCDIYVVPVALPHEGECEPIRVMVNCRRFQVFRFMVALDPLRFPRKTYEFLIAHNTVIRTTELQSDPSRTNADSNHS